MPRMQNSLSSRRCSTSWRTRASRETSVSRDASWSRRSTWWCTSPTRMGADGSLAWSPWSVGGTTSGSTARPTAEGSFEERTLSATSAVWRRGSAHIFRVTRCQSHDIRQRTSPAMTVVSHLPEPVILVAGVALIVACGCAGIAAILGVQPLARTSQPRTIPLLEHEKDVAAALGWPWRRWIALRAGVTIAGVAVGFLTQVWLLSALLGAVGFFGVRFLVAGRAARRRLRMERAFLVQLRVLRDRMAIGNQSLDSALQEVGRNPGQELAYVLEPWAQGGSVTGNIVQSGLRSRSPLVEHACTVLIWARTRSLDGLISAIDDALLSVGEAQLQVQEESLVTLTQQRAVTFAMSA